MLLVGLYASEKEREREGCIQYIETLYKLEVVDTYDYAQRVYALTVHISHLLLSYFMLVYINYQSRYQLN